LLSALAKLNARIDLKSYKAGLQKKMTAAGDPLGMKLTADEFIAFSQLAAIVGAVVFVVFGKFSFPAIFLGGMAGYALSHLWLNDAMKKRKLSIRRQLPDFLDVLTLTVEAGLDFNAALARILKISKKAPLTDEFKLMMQELKLGTTRYMALKEMAERVDIPDFSAFISALLQTDQLGASLGPTLRIQADQMREKRMQMAEKAGGEASVKLLLPLMIFIFPAVFMILFGPIIIKLIIN
jgi:tight adherence protein C